MKNKLDEIIERLDRIKSETGEGFLTLLCFLALCVMCSSQIDAVEEQKRTNTNLRTIINILNHDSIMDSHEDDSEKVKDKSTNHKTK